MIDRIVFLFCFLIDVLQFGLVVYLYNCFWRKIEPQNLLLLRIFLYVNLYKLLFNGIIVDLLRIISGGAENKEYGVSSFEILQVVGIDLISNIIYYSAFTFFLIVLKSRSINKTVSLGAQITIMSLISVFSTLNLLLPQLFIEKLWLIKDALFYMGPLCGTITLVLGIKYKRKMWIFLGFLPLIVTILLTLISGLRGSIVGISICFIVLVIIELEKKRARKILLIGIIPLFVLSLIQESLNSIKYAFVVAATSKTMDFSTFGGYVDFVTAYVSDDSIIKKVESDSKPIYREVEFRYGAPSLFAVGFTRMAAKGEYAYFNPILNSFYSFLPRQIFKGEKPFPGSADGTEKRMGMYACYNEVTGYDHNMTDFTVSGHYYWELGWFGVFFLSIIPALYNVLVFNFSKGWGYVGAVLFMITFKPFWLLTKLWISEIIIMLPTVILPAVALIYILKFMIKYIKFSQTPQHQ